MSEYHITVRQSLSMQPKHHARLLYLVQVLKNQIMYSNFPAVLCLSCLLWHFLCSLCRVPYNYCDAQKAFRYTTSSLPLGITWRSGGNFLGGRSRIRSERNNWNTNETPIFSNDLESSHWNIQIYFPWMLQVQPEDLKDSFFGILAW